MSSCMPTQEMIVDRDITKLPEQLKVKIRHVLTHLGEPCTPAAFRRWDGRVNWRETYKELMREDRTAYVYARDRFGRRCGEPFCVDVNEDDLYVGRYEIIEWWDGGKVEPPVAPRRIPARRQAGRSHEDDAKRQGPVGAPCRLQRGVDMQEARKK
jgi:hypothetical protein